MDVREHGGRLFEVAIASDLIREGMALELTDLGSSESGTRDRRRTPAHHRHVRWRMVGQGRNDPLLVGTLSDAQVEAQ